VLNDCVRIALRDLESAFSDQPGAIYMPRKDGGTYLHVSLCIKPEILDLESLADVIRGSINSLYKSELVSDDLVGIEFNFFREAYATRNRLVRVSIFSEAFLSATTLKSREFLLKTPQEGVFCSWPYGIPDCYKQAMG